jgi:hypothetical protein
MPYIYLLQRKVHFNTNIFKIGKTIDIKQRLSAADYRQCKIICIVWVNNCDEAEKNVINQFKQEFKSCKIINETYEGKEDFYIDDINKAISIIFKLTDNIDLVHDETIVNNKEIKITLENWWDNYNSNYINEDFNSSFDKIEQKTNNWLNLINKWPFYYNKTKQINFQDCFEPIRLDKNGEIYFKIKRHNGLKEHYLFDALINRNKLRTRGLSDAKRLYNIFINSISHIVNKSGNKFKYYDINNDLFETTACEYILDSFTLKLFNKQILTDEDKFKHYVKFGIQHDKFIKPILNNKKIMNKLLNSMFMNYIVINTFTTKEDIINYINYELESIDLNLIIPWLIHNNVLIVISTDDLELYYDLDNNIILNLNENEYSKEIKNKINLLKSK